MTFHLIGQLFLTALLSLGMVTVLHAVLVFSGNMGEGENGFLFFLGCLIQLLRAALFLVFCGCALAACYGLLWQVWAT